MKAPFSRSGIILPVALTALTVAHQVSAACSRDDVEYYLNKGFTTNQITAICQGSSAPAAPAGTAKPRVSAPVAEPAGRAPARAVRHTDEPPAAIGNDNEIFLKTAISSPEVFLTADALHYTREMCIEYGAEDLYGFAPKACPDVKFTIAFDGLEVLKAGKKYGFYGPAEVQVKGSIQREIIGQLRDQKPRDRKRILEKFESGDRTMIPVREDISLDRVKAVLRRLAD